MKQMDHIYIVLYERNDFSLKPSIWVTSNEEMAHCQYKKTIEDLIELHKDSKCSITFETSQGTYESYGLRQTNIEFFKKDGTKQEIKILMERNYIREPKPRELPPQQNAKTLV